MNKETRTFIWGLLLLTICSISFSKQLNVIIDGNFNGGIEWVFLAFSIYGIAIGGIKVLKNTY